MKIRLMSFNTQHCLNYKTRKIDFELMAQTILNLGGEIVGLQEMRGRGKDEDYTDQTKELARITGYNYYFAKALDVDGVNPYGNAILSKYPIISAQTIAIPDPEIITGECETRCVLKAKIDVGFELTVLVCHFGLAEKEQENAAKTVIKELETQNCVLMGDFNVTPENPNLKDIRRLMFDTACAFDNEKLSFPSDNPAEKIDYLFTSKNLKVVFADIPDVVASDHRPYVCDIDV